MTVRLPFSRIKVASVVLMAIASLSALALAKDATGAITGTADPGVQIVILNLDSGEIVGVMAKCDGSYRAESLKPGHYQIIESRPHHAARKLSVTAGQDSHVDLAPASSIQTKCTPS